MIKLITYDENGNATINKISILTVVKLFIVGYIMTVAIMGTILLLLVILLGVLSVLL